MSSGLEVCERREATDKATCDHYAYPVWVSVVGPRQREKYWARCKGCEAAGRRYGIEQGYNIVLGGHSSRGSPGARRENTLW